MVANNFNGSSRSNYNSTEDCSNTHIRYHKHRIEEEVNFLKIKHFTHFCKYVRRKLLIVMIIYLNGIIFE